MSKAAKKFMDKGPKAEEEEEDMEEKKIGRAVWK